MRLTGRCRTVESAALGVLVVLAVGLAGCSSNAPSTPKVLPPAPSLQPADLPADWSQIGTLGPPDPVQRQQLFTCLGATSPLISTQTSSALYGITDGESAYSATEVFSTTAAASSYLHDLASPNFGKCASNLVSQIFSSLPPGTSFGTPSVTKGVPPAISRSTVSYRLAMPTSSRTKSGTATADIVYVLNQTSVVQVVFIDATAPPSSVSELAVLQALFPRT